MRGAGLNGSMSTGGSAVAPGRRDALLGLLLVLLTCALLFQARAWQPGSMFDGHDNVQIAEAQAWWNGRLSLPEYRWDTALVDDRAYSHFPPMYSFLAAVVVPFCAGVPYWLVLLLIVLPVPLLAYRLFLILTGSPAASALIAIGFVCGTSIWPVIDQVLRVGNPYFVNPLLGTIGTLIILAEYFGRRRMWLAGGGLVVAALSRQLTLAWLIPLAWLAVRNMSGNQRRRGLVATAVAGLVVLGVIACMNTLKYGQPLDSGYMRIYTEDHNHPFVRDARKFGLFSVRFVPRNLYYANVGLPKIQHFRRAEGTGWRLQPHVNGAGIWWTTPLLLWFLIDFRRITRDGRSFPLLAAAGVIYAALMCFHNTGYAQPGFNRFSLDYLPALFAMIAPHCLAGRRKWISLAMIGWSVVYFRWLI